MNLGSMFGNGLQGLLSDEEQEGLGKQSLFNSGLAILAASQGGQPGTGRAPLFPALLQGLQAGQQTFAGGAENLLKVQDLKKKREAMAQGKQLLGGLVAAPDPTQQALAGGGGPTVANAEKLQGAQASNLVRMMDAYRKALLIDDGGKTAEQIKGLIESEKPKYEKYGEGETIINPATGQVIAQGAPKKTDNMREYEYALSQGEKGLFKDFQTQLKRAGATVLAPSFKIGNTFGEDVAKGVAGNVMGQVNAGEAAASTVATVQNMRAALPNAITGTGANARIAWTRLAQTLGVGGKNDAESLAATSQVVQGLAQTQLQMAQANKGQGTFTDFERGLLARAASGDINMAAAELKTLFNALEKGARKQYSVASKQVSRMQQTPMFEQVAPFMTLPDLPAAQDNDPLGMRGK